MPTRHQQPLATATQPPLPAERAFVVQFSADTDPQQGRFVGRMEHILSGQARHFRSAHEVFEFVTNILADLPTPPRKPQTGNE